MKVVEHTDLMDAFDLVLEPVLDTHAYFVVLMSSCVVPKVPDCIVMTGPDHIESGLVGPDHIDPGLAVPCHMNPGLAVPYYIDPGLVLLDHIESGLTVLYQIDLGLVVLDYIESGLVVSVYIECCLAVLVHIDCVTCPADLLMLVDYMFYLSACACLEPLAGCVLLLPASLAFRQMTSHLWKIHTPGFDIRPVILGPPVGIHILLVFLQIPGVGTPCTSQQCSACCHLSGSVVSQPDSRLACLHCFVVLYCSLYFGHHICLDRASGSL